MDQDDFLLLQAEEEIEGDFDLKDLQTELEHIETDDDLKADEDQIIIKQKFEKDQEHFEMEFSQEYQKRKQAEVKIDNLRDEI